MGHAPKPYVGHIRQYEDLITPYDKTRAGFVSIALERNERAAPHIAEAKDLKVKASKAKNPIDLASMSSIRSGLITAAGISDKATGHIDELGQAEAINGLIEKYLEPAGSEFVEELIYRFLLTRGDALGGSMRNLVGVLAQRKFTRAFVASLRIAGTAFEWLPNVGKTNWLESQDADPQNLEAAKGFSWKHNGKNRVLLYNVKIPFLGVKGNSVDMCLLNCKHDQISEKTICAHNSYIALGELKGGIDPAGADEHWKTANSALSRVRKKFKEHRFAPYIFFVGAAIENAMAHEIWSQLEKGELENAANLTQDNQLSSLCHWLSTL